MKESRLTFFRQSGWLGIANTLTGLFLMLVYPLISRRLPDEEIAVYTAMLRFFTILALPAAALQIVMAQDAARAITPEDQARFRGTVRGVVQGIFLLWVVIAFLSGVFRSELVGALQLTHPAQLWVAVVLVLAQLCMPFMQGIVQGLQNFLWLGLSILGGGAARFLCTALFVLVFKAHATGALIGALIGILIAIGMAGWAGRHALMGPAAGFAWREWLGRVLPLAGGTGSVLFVMQADMLLVQSHFPSEVTAFYAAASVIGVGLVTFTTPMAAVMFPKLVRSFAKGERSNSLWLALAGTFVMGVAGALLCTVFPELPLRIMFFRKPEFLQSAVLVPWVAWCMLPLIMANVLISSLMARGRFAAVPWLMAVAIGYGLAQYHLVNNAGQGLPVFEAFTAVIQRLGIFSSLLLLVAFIFAVVLPRFGRPSPPAAAEGG